MHRRAGAIFAAALLMLSGCSALVAPAGTETPTPTSSPTPGGKQVAPGVTTEGISDPFALVSAHEDVLAGQSFRVHQVTRQRYANGTLRTRMNETVVMAADRSHYRFRRRVAGRVARLLGASQGKWARYANGTAVLQRIVIHGETTYAVVHGPDREARAPARVFHGRPVPRDRLFLLLTRLQNVTVSKRETGTYVVTATAMTGDKMEVDVGRVDSFELGRFRAVVTDDGLIRSYRLTYTGIVNGHKITGLRKATYSALGTASVTPPDWVDEARNRTNPP